MIEKLKKLGTSALGVVGLIAMFAIPIVLTILFLKGALWASENLLRALILIGFIVIVLDIVILLPLSVFRRLRPHTGGLIYLSSYLFGLVTWLYGFIVTYALWGGFAVVVGLSFFGVGVVFMAILASLFKAMWEPFFTVLVLAAFTYGSRLAGFAIGNAQPTQNVDLAI
jgi:hypothetical protein